MSVRFRVLIWPLGCALLCLACMRVAASSYVDFFRALDVDNVTTIRELLARGFDPNTPDERGQLPLYLAFRGGAERTAQLLMTHPDTKLERANALGETALMMAALRGREDWVTTLLSRGAVINRDGWTPLHYAVSGPSLAVARLLLERGAWVDARAPTGATPLMTAAQHGSEEAVMLLLQRGADRNLRDLKDRTAADLARSVGRENLARHLASSP